MTTETDKIKLLIVDNSAISRRQIAYMLEGRNFQFTSAGTGEKAIASVKERSPDIVLIDSQLTDMDAMDCLLQIRQNLSTKKTKFVVMVQSDAYEIKRQAYQLGCSEVISKPLSERELVDKLTKLVRFVQISRASLNTRNTMSRITPVSNLAI